VAGPAGGEGNDQAHRPRGIVRGVRSRRVQQRQRSNESQNSAKHLLPSRASLYTNCTAIPPSAPKSACSVSPLPANTTRVNEPASTRCPGSSAPPKLASLFASHATPSAGWPSTPAATPAPSISEFLYM